MSGNSQQGDARAAARASPPESDCAPGPEPDPAREVAIAQFSMLAGLSVAACVLGAPFWERKALVSAVFAMIALLSLWARWRSTKGGHVAAAHVVATLVVALAMVLMATSAHIVAPTLLVVTVLPGYAAVCGRRWAGALGGAYVASSVAVQVAASLGFAVPKVFPVPPAAEVFASAFAIVGVVGPLSLVYDRLLVSFRRAERESRERRRAEASLWAANARTLSMLGAIPDAMLELDAGGRCVDVWNAGRTMPAAFWGGMRGSPLADALGPRAAGAIRRTLELAARGGHAEGERAPVSTGEGEKVFELTAVRVNAPALRSDPHDAEGGFVVLLHDVTERRQNDDRLRELGVAIEQAVDGIVFADLDGNVRYANPSWAAIHGRTSQDLVGRHIGMFYTAAQMRDEVLPAIAQIREQGVFKGEVHHVRADGTTFPTWTTVTLVRDADDNPAGMVAVAQDITERKRAEDELARYRAGLEDLVEQRTHELERANESLQSATRAAEESARAKADFLASMSHEIRTPMNAIIGLSHLAQGADATPAQRELLGKIQEAGRHLLGVVDDILDFSKSEAGKLAIERAPFDLDAVLDFVVALLGEEARRKGLELSLEVDSRVPRNLVGDALRIRQVLLNFGSNALKFTERGGVRIAVSARPGGDGASLLRFDVIDTGIGLTGEQRQTLFQSFQQGDTSITRRFGGSGLGLVISKRLAELMGGEVGVDSEPGKGSTFWFTVVAGVAPSAPGAAQPAADEPARAGGVDGARVLVVEDNHLNQEVARELLAGFGVAVDIAENGEEALAKVCEADYDMVFMDMQMPVMDGIEATRRIRALPGFAKLPIVAMTANAMQQDRERCLEAGMNGHLAKPIEPDDLHAVLLKWVEPRERAAAGVPAAPAPEETGEDVVLPTGIRGLDADTGLRWAGGKVSVYVPLLRQFADEHHGAADEARRALADGDAKAAERIAHTIRGVAHMLGAAAVRTAAADLERALGAGEPAASVEALLAEFGRALDALVADIRHAT